MVVDRDNEIQLLKTAEERAQGYLQAWLKRPEFKAALHRYDHEVCGDDGRRVAGAR